MHSLNLDELSTLINVNQSIIDCHREILNKSGNYYSMFTYHSSEARIRRQRGQYLAFTYMTRAAKKTPGDVTLRQISCKRELVGNNWRGPPRTGDAGEKLCMAHAPGGPKDASTWWRLTCEAVLHGGCLNRLTCLRAAFASRRHLRTTCSSVTLRWSWCSSISLVNKRRANHVILVRNTW